MNGRDLSKIYNSFQPNTRLKTILYDAVRIFVTSTDIEQDTWDSIMVIHICIETDWLNYSRKKNCPGQYYVSLHQIQEKVAIFLKKKGDLGPPTFILFLVYGKFTTGTADIEVSRPQVFTIWTADDIIKKTEEKNTEQLNYLEQSLLLGHV